VADLIEQWWDDKPTAEARLAYELNQAMQEMTRQMTPLVVQINASMTAFEENLRRAYVDLGRVLSSAVGTAGRTPIRRTVRDAAAQQRSQQATAKPAATAARVAAPKGPGYPRGRGRGGRAARR
jgi:hypothetical protein